MQQKIENIENKLINELNLQKKNQINTIITKSTDRYASGRASPENVEKLRGKFKVTINKNLKTSEKIEHFAQDPIAFHLYKKRKFFDKIIDKSNHFYLIIFHNF
jgi:hypothetical protein